MPRFLVRAQNLRLHLFQLRRDEALAADGRLLANVTFRHVRQIRFGDLDEITEHGIEPDLERFDPGLGDLAFLELRDPILSLARALPELVEIAVESVPENSPLLQ